MIVGTVELKLSVESLLALDAHTKALERLAAAIEGVSRFPTSNEVAKRDAPGPAQPAATVGGTPLAPARWPSPERDALILRMRREGKPWRDIFWAICELPGTRPPTLDAVKTYARDKLGATRPAETYSAHDRARIANMRAARGKSAGAPVSSPPSLAVAPQNIAVPVPPAAAPAPPAAGTSAPQSLTRAAVMERVATIRPGLGAGERHEADFEQVRHWAAARDVEFETWEDLPRVNAKADQLGVSGFKRRFARGAA